MVRVDIVLYILLGLVIIACIGGIWCAVLCFLERKRAYMFSGEVNCCDTGCESADMWDIKPISYESLGLD